MNSTHELPIPEGLTKLLVSGVWPRDSITALEQNSRSLIAAENVRRFAAEESLIYLYPPPFATVAHEMATGNAGEFWRRFGALHQIVPKKILIIGDFGAGSDTAIVLDFAANDLDPPVLRLRWNPDGQTEWVKGASGFDEFASIVGLTPI